MMISYLDNGDDIFCFHPGDVAGERAYLHRGLVCVAFNLPAIDAQIRELERAKLALTPGLEPGPISRVLHEADEDEAADERAQDESRKALLEPRPGEDILTRSRRTLEVDREELMGRT